MSQTPNSSACRPLTPPQSFTVASRDSYHWSPPPPAFSLSSVHSLQPLSTYLVPTEQCRWRRTLKDRLDCLGILISPFFLHTSWPHALLCCILLQLRCFSPSLSAQNCVFSVSRLKETSSCVFPSSTVAGENRKLLNYHLQLGVCSFSAFAQRHCCICSGSAISVWGAVITVPHCLCGSQWSWTHCLSLHGSQQLRKFPGDFGCTLLNQLPAFFISLGVSTFAL